MLRILFVLTLCAHSGFGRSTSPVQNASSYVFITFGASGDLAKKEIYPALWRLFSDNLLPNNTIFYGYARSNLTIAELRARCEPNMQVKSGEEARYEEFWQLNRYFAGTYDSHNFKLFDQELLTIESTTAANRLFYLAVPPSVFESITELIKVNCMSKNGWNRVVIEKPFGKDTESSNKLSNHLSKLFTEDQIYRIDHYLGKEMVKNLLNIRFANRIFSSSWNRENIASVMITLNEPFGIVGRGAYFDEYGMIRDVMQNHLLQVLSLVAMEEPASADPDDIRDEKVNVLKNVDAIKLEDTLLGQYVGDPNGEGIAKIGYLNDSTVPDGSRTETYALTVLRINNERWNGVPFIMRSGKALNEHRVEVRIQYQDVTGKIFGDDLERNELVIRIQPDEALYIKMMTKSPGITSDENIEETELDLTYGCRYKDVIIPEAYENLILDVFSGNQMNFVRTDELNEAWRIFTPVLHEIETKQISPIPYVYGTPGPRESYQKYRENNFEYYGTDNWQPECTKAN